MPEFYAHFPVVMWVIDGIIWAIGVFFWVVTYIAAPIESRKKGHTVSGLPGMAFLFFLVAGFLSPNKWLMLMSLTDVSVLSLIITVCKECACKRKSNEHDTHENFANAKIRRDKN